MSEGGRRSTDPELEKFLRENKEMMERLFRENKEMMDRFFREEKERFRGAFDEEMKRAEAFAGERKDKAKDTAQEVYNAFTDPEVQRHFMAMGMEFMMAMSALMSAMPFPDQMKDMAKKAEEARKSASDNSSKAGAGRSKGTKSAAPEKINVEPAPKKKPQSKAKRSSADRDDS
ncbi:MAG: hypothetical protein FWC29_04480 [Methanomassiliicoccaceae archaeon]|nr:hypothetical protein [Methanomassiliicoccaceae archaeon]